MPLLAGLPLAANAVDFGPLQLKSGHGEPLVAQIDIRAEAGDVLDERCLRVSAPAAGQPAVRGATLRLVRDGAATATASLRISSPEAQTEPAATLRIEADCGAGRVWRDFPVRLKQAASSSRIAASGEWIVAPGESPASLARLLFPGQAAVQRRFIAALAEANPMAGIDAAGTQALPPGTPLQMPDWRTLAARSAAGGDPRPAAAQPAAPQAAAVSQAQPRPAAPPPTQPMPAAMANSPAAPSHRPAPAGTPTLRLSWGLSAPVETGEQTRQVLRQEYRLLGALNDQLSMQREIAREGGSPAVAQPARPQSASPLPATAPAAATQPAPETPAPPASAASPSVPQPAADAEPARVHLPQAGPAPTDPVAHEETPWSLYGGSAAAVLLLAGLLLRRRRPAAQPATFEIDQTVLAEPSPRSSESQPEARSARPGLHPASPPEFAPAAAVPVADAAATQAAQQRALAAMPQPPDQADVNPVMELAEIMLSFGRLEGAAQTLVEYIEANPKEALQPWVKLLDIYRAADMRAEFDELAEKLHTNFNVERQYWSTPPTPVEEDAEQIAKALTLEDVPHIRERLVSEWGKPECLDYLHQLLRDNRGGQRSGFTLPVVQEILLLIDVLVARDTAAAAA